MLSKLNLDLKGVFIGANEGLDLQVLLDRLEKQLDLPAILVNGPDGGGPEVQMVGQQHDLPLVFLIPHDDGPQGVGAILRGFGATEVDQLISLHIFHTI